MTRRPYLLVGFFHMVIGLLLFSCGVAWLVMTFVYWPAHKNDEDGVPAIIPGLTPEQFFADNPWTRMPTEHQALAWIVYTAQIWTGFWVRLNSSIFIAFKTYHLCKGIS